MRHAVHLFLETDTIDYIDGLGRSLLRQRGDEQISRSEVVAWLVKQHWKKAVRKKTLAKSRPGVLA